MISTFFRKITDTCDKVMFKFFDPMSSPPGWKCLKWFKLSLRVPWKSKGNNDSDIDTDEVVLHKKNVYKNHKQQGTNYNDETLLDKIKSHNHYQ